MNRLKNKDGSAILWTVLFTNILAILLGSLLTLSYGYHKSTIETVKKQQAYFTARSATDAIISEIAVNGSDSKLMPASIGRSIEVKDITFDIPVDTAKGDKSATKMRAFNMGSADAVIKKENESLIEITVNSRYADNTYKMTAKLRNQPLYFGGIAIKNLTFKNNGKLVLTEGTDLYYDSENKSVLTGNLNIGGNLIANGNINLSRGSVVAGVEFKNGLCLDNSLATNHPKKLIYDSKHFVISNFTLDAEYPDFRQTKTMLIKSLLKGNYNRVRCNNSYCHPKELSLVDRIFGKSSIEEDSHKNDVRYIKITNRTIGKINKKLQNEILYADDNQLSLKIGLDQIFNPEPFKDSHFKNTDDNTNDIVPESVCYTPSDFWSARDAGYAYLDGWSRYVVEDGSRYHLKDCYDTEYIDYSSTAFETHNDKVSSVAYVLVDKDCKLKVKYGIEPDKWFIFENIDDFIDWVKKGKMTYLNVYLGENAVLDLGDHADLSDKKNKARLNFYMSVYGDKNSTLVLRNGVTLHGSAYVDNLVIDGNSEIDYMAQNGGKVARQKIDELWTISNYSD